MVTLFEKLGNREQLLTKYIDTHKRHVEQSFNEKLLPYLKKLNASKELILDVSALIKVHDNSKYAKAEFPGYLCHFHPINDEEKNSPKTKIAWDRAWLHHQNTNPHHPEYWILRDNRDAAVILDMPEPYILEMLCDWDSFSYLNLGTAYEYYEKEKDNKPFTQNTKTIIEKYIHIFK